MGTIQDRSNHDIPPVPSTSVDLFVEEMLAKHDPSLLRGNELFDPLRHDRSVGPVVHGAISYSSRERSFSERDMEVFMMGVAFALIPLVDNVEAIKADLAFAEELAQGLPKPS